MRRLFRLTPLGILTAVAVLAAFAPARTQGGSVRGPFDALHFRDIGPAASGGRIHDIQIDPKDPAVLYAAAASQPKRGAGGAGLSSGATRRQTVA